MDPTIVNQTFQRQQEQAGYYLFRDLDVDRYKIDGKTQQVVLAVRELNRDNIPTTTWEGPPPRLHPRLRRGVRAGQRGPR